MAGCSTTVVMMVLRSGWAFSADRMAVESDSVPQEVKMISESCSAPSRAAPGCGRFQRLAHLAAKGVHRRGVAKVFGENGSMASTTAGSTRVVALLSR